MRSPATSELIPVFVGAVVVLAPLVIMAFFLS